jgi:para-aminobenzoate synthetase component 1
VRLSELESLPSFALLGPGFADEPLILVEALVADDVAPDIAYLPYEGDPGRPIGWSGRRTTVEAIVVDVDAANLGALEFEAEAYAVGVDSIRASIAAGDVYQVNLTTRIGLGAVTAGALWARLSARGLAPYAAWVRAPGVEFVSASPELLFRIDGERVSAQPMKGTAPAGQAAQLLASAKDEAELAMITDLLRNDLTPVCRPRSVRVEAERRLVSLPYAVQAVSDVVGLLEDGRSWRDVLAALHPGGSITGAPKSTACEHIAALETSPRGPYCGTLVALDGDRAVASLLIRTASRMPDGHFAYGVGAGITWGSEPAQEVEELRVKLGALR